MARRTVTLVITVHNEEQTIGRLLDSIRAQTRPPDEIVITDAGSTDRTTEIVNEYVVEGLPARLLIEPGANRARGRNLAIAASTGEVIASTDAGCQADSGWLAALAAPFEGENPPDVVSGYYRPEAYSLWEQAIAAATVPAVREINRRTFLPSSRSIAFTREAWQRVGGYPEYIEYAEDTAFDLRLREARQRLGFAPQAIVSWQMQPLLSRVFRQFFRYARSDGQLGYFFAHYTKAYVLAAVALLMLVLLARSPGSALVLLLLGAGYWWRYTARARRRGGEWPAALLSPLVSMTVDAAHVLGYTIGCLRRRPGPARLPTEQPLSVAQITYTYQPIAGGADVYVSQLADLVTTGGHRHVVYQRRAPTEAPGVRFVPNPFHGRPLEFWTHGLALFRLWRELRAHDVVICHYPHYLLAVCIINLFRRRPARVAVSHGVFWDDAPRSLRSFIKAWIADLAFRRAHLYIANDTHFLRAMGVRIEPRQRMHSQIAPGVWFIPNGVDPQKFLPTEPVPDIRVLNAILVPRNLFRNRGIHLAIDAFALFRAKHPETTLVIVGDVGQPEYAAELRGDVLERGLADSVVFRGRVPHEELPAVYSSAQLTLIPSLCGEGTSLSALESMACGTATICTYVAGLRDLPGPHAVPLAQNLAEVMERVWPDRHRIGEDQQQEVFGHYSIDNWRSSWRAALTEVGVPLVRTNRAASGTAS